MSNFVYGGDWNLNGFMTDADVVNQQQALAAGKPLPNRLAILPWVSADQQFGDAGTLALKAAADIRLALRQGDWHGLGVMNPASPVEAPVAGSRRRNYGGVDQLSEAVVRNGAWRSSSDPGLIYVRDYVIGADADDQTAGIQAAYDDAQANNADLIFEANRIYKVFGELNFGNGSTSNQIHIHGRGATIQANGKPWNPVTAPDGQRSAVFFGAGLVVDRLTVSGGRVARYAAFIDGADYGDFHRCTFSFGIQDAVNLGNSGAGNDSLGFNTCTFSYSGQIFRSPGNNPPTTAFDGFSPAPTGVPRVDAPGSVTVAGGSNIVTGNGTTFTQGGFREGDFIAIAGDSSTDVNDSTTQWGMIQSVDSDTQITCYTYPRFTAASNKAYAICCGAGIRQEETNEGANLFMNRPHVYNTAGGGIRVSTLYGGTFINPQLDATSSFPFQVGAALRASNTGNTVIGPYFEFMNTPTPFYAGQAAGLVVIGAKRPTAPLVTASNTNTVTGFEVGSGPFDVGTPGNPIGNGFASIPYQGNLVSIMPQQGVQAPPAAPADNLVAPQEVVFYLNQSTNHIFAKVRYSDTVTVKTIDLGALT